jgi:hypothetical protein
MRFSGKFGDRRDARRQVQTNCGPKEDEAGLQRQERPPSGQREERRTQSPRGKHNDPVVGETPSRKAGGEQADDIPVA